VSLGGLEAGVLLVVVQLSVEHPFDFGQHQGKLDLCEEEVRGHPPHGVDAGLVQILENHLPLSGIEAFGSRSRNGQVQPVKANIARFMPAESVIVKRENRPCGGVHMVLCLLILIDVSAVELGLQLDLVASHRGVVELGAQQRLFEVDDPSCGEIALVFLFTEA
jgi:hypothetical protein